MTRVLLTPATHGFFDELVTLLVSLSSFNAAVESFWNRGITTIPNIPNHSLRLYGRFVVVEWKPNAFMHDVTRDRWPTMLSLDLLDPKAPEVKVNESGVPFASSAVAAMVHGLIGSMFITYFERVRDQVETKFGASVSTWPCVWNFGRTVRNALTHRGVLEIQSANAPPVSWRNVTLTYADNGQELLTPTKFLGVGDLIPLLLEMDASVA
jgi:hypothetical protein